MCMNVLYWMGLFIVLLVIEIATVSLISIWFCLGALAAVVSVLLGADLYIQLLVFAVVSCIALILTRPIAKKYFKAPHRATNVNALIGQEVMVLSDIDNDAGKGEIKINDVIWPARTTDGKKVLAGEKVIIDSVKGVKLYVSEIKKEV